MQIPENSAVPSNQEKMMKATRGVLNAIADDVQKGLLETVGVASALSMDGARCSMLLELPAGTDTKLIARAIDAENIEAWTDEQEKVHIGLNPWFSTKDIDQAVLCTIKVIHVLLGIHATDAEQPKTLKQKLLASVAEVLQIQHSVKRDKN